MRPSRLHRAGSTPASTATFQSRRFALNFCHAAMDRAVLAGIATDTVARNCSSSYNPSRRNRAFGPLASLLPCLPLSQ